MGHCCTDGGIERRRRSTVRIGHLHADASDIGLLALPKGLIDCETIPLACCTPNTQIRPGLSTDGGEVLCWILYR